jgi:hypothetical protein
VTRPQIERLIEEYGAGLQAEIEILHQLWTTARRQKACTEARDFERLGEESDARDGVTGRLVQLEETLAPLRCQLASIRTEAATLPGYQRIVHLRREAADLVSTVLAVDQESLRALSDADAARRAALACLEKGETTLAAYRKVIAPPPAPAAMVDRLG